MRLSKSPFPSVHAARSVHTLGKGRSRVRQCSLAALALLLSGCAAANMGGEDEIPFAGVAADEPRAAQVARNVLAQGGSAADAAVALYFALTVTRPSQASLGAGGTCLAWDARDPTIRAINFKQPPSATGQPEVAPPGAPRAMAVLHGLHGRQRWSQVVAPAEALARFGHRVSRAFATDLAEADPRLFASGGMGVFAPGGQVLGEGAELVQPDLAATLTTIRTDGATALHDGPVADRLLSGIARFGGRLDRTELASFAPRVDEPIVKRLGSTRVAFTPWFETQGPYQALLWEAMARRSFSGTGEGERPHLVAEAAGRAHGALAAAMASSEPVAGWASESQAAELMAGYRPDRHTAPSAAVAASRRGGPAGTGFVVADGRGGGVACGLTMGRPFGAGRVAEGTGVIPAIRSDAAVDDDALSPMLAMNPNSNVLFFLGAGSGPGAATAIVEVAARVLAAEQPLGDAMAAARVEHRGVPDATFVEPAAVDAVRTGLEGRGHRVERLPAPSVLNAVSCPEGLPRSPDSCVLAADKRGFGLDAVVRR